VKPASDRWLWKRQRTIISPNQAGDLQKDVDFSTLYPTVFQRRAFAEAKAVTN
jgi:hypothetical protein